MIPNTKQVVSGNGIRDEFLGSVSLEVEIADRPLCLNALVIRGKGHELILGFDFLQSHDLLVDCKSCCLTSRY